MSATTRYSGSGDLPENQPSTTGQSIAIRTGDDSPVSVNAPQVNAGAGATATANLHQPGQPAVPVEPHDRAWWRSGLLLWTVVIALGTLAILYFTIFPGHK